MIRVQRTVAAGLVGVAGTACLGDVPSLHWLGRLPGGFYSEASAISGSGGTAVGTASAGGFADHAYRWTLAGGLQDLGTLGGLDSNANDTSLNGSVVVGWSHLPGNQTIEAFHWTGSDGMRGLGYLPGDNQSFANAISGDGATIAGGSAPNAGSARAFRWTAQGGMRALGFVGVPRAVSFDGSVIVGAGPEQQAFIWTEATGVRYVGGNDAFDVSADGTVAVGFRLESGFSRAFRWSTATDAGEYIGPARTVARGVSGDGSVIVGSSQSGATMWTATGGMTTVRGVLLSLGVTEAQDAILSEAVGVSDDGLTIVGIGVRPGELNQQAWVAVVPAPGSGVVALLAVGWGARRGNRRTIGNLRTAPVPSSRHPHPAAPHPVPTRLLP